MTDICNSQGLSNFVSADGFASSPRPDMLAWLRLSELDDNHRLLSRPPSRRQ
jgi:hypothetical protein